MRQAQFALRGELSQRISLLQQWRYIPFQKNAGPRGFAPRLALSVRVAAAC
jgi:hypothetical protein